MSYSLISLAASGLLKLARMLNIWYTDRREAYWQLVYCCKLSNKMLIPSTEISFYVAFFFYHHILYISC